MVRWYILVFTCFIFLTVVSQEEDEFENQLENQGFFTTISTEKLDLRPSKGEGIPLFLVDEGFSIDQCNNQISLENVKKCTLKTLENLLKAEISTKIHRWSSKDSATFITTSIIVDTLGKSQFKDVAITRKGLKTKGNKDAKIAYEIQEAIAKFPKLLPGKNRGEVQIVKVNLNLEFSGKP